MKQVKLYPKIAFDFFFEQFKWSAWFYSFLLLAHIIGIFLVNQNGENLDGFFIFSSYATAIFMLVCGIMAAFGFMSYSVQQGISRKDMHLGIVIGAFGLAVAVTLIPLLLNGIEHLIAGSMSLPIDTDDIAAYPISTGWFSAVVIYLLNVFTYYLIGWFIGIGYYRFNWLIGLGFVVISMAAFTINGFFWGDNGLNAIIPWIPNISSDAGPIAAIAGSVVLIAVLLISTRLLTKRIPIKL